MELFFWPKLEKQALIVEPFKSHPTGDGSFVFKEEFLSGEE